MSNMSGIKHELFVEIYMKVWYICTCL